MAKLRVGQVIAIPVLTRHIFTSSGKCANGESVSRNCIMADALRDRFPGAEEVSVGSATAQLIIPGVYVELRGDDAFGLTTSTFDDNLDEVKAGTKTLPEAIAAIRSGIPRVVHATVSYIDA